MTQNNEMSARTLTMEEMENVNGGIPSHMRQIVKKTRSDYEAKII